MCVDVQGLSATMRGTSGSVKMGMLRWQSRLAEFFTERFSIHHNRDVREDIVAAARPLAAHCGNGLQRLTKNPKVDVKFEWRQATISETLTQEGLLNLAAPTLVEAIGQTIANACRAAGPIKPDIDHVILTGGLMRIIEASATA